MFLQNHWYAVAWDHEIGAKPIARTICGEPIVFFRRPDRSVVALEDVCPHRLAPLSQGQVKDGNLVCGYHGLAFNGEGRCVHMPNQQGVMAGLDVRAYPIAERYRFVWVWIGAAEKADERLLPDLPYCESPDWTFDGDTFHVACDYRLLVDNLMDLTHEAYVHPTSIGQEELSETPIETVSDDTSVTVSRWMRNVTPPPFWAANLKSTEPCDRWQICRFTLPAHVMIDVGVALAGTGAPEGDRSQGVTGIVFDVMTPETETTTWYHWGMARNFEIDDRGLTGRIREAQAQVFREDIAVLEGQQANIGRLPERYLANFNIDEGGVRARRLIRKALAAQEAENAAPVAAE